MKSLQVLSFNELLTFNYTKFVLLYNKNLKIEL